MVYYSFDCYGKGTMGVNHKTVIGKKKQLFLVLWFTQILHNIYKWSHKERKLVWIRFPKSTVYKNELSE